MIPEGSQILPMGFKDQLNGLHRIFGQDNILHLIESRDDDGGFPGADFFGTQ